MQRHSRSVAFATLVLAGSVAASARQQPAEPVETERQDAGTAAEHLMLRGTVRRVLAPGVFVLDDRRAPDGETLVLALDPGMTPAAGADVIAGGRLRRFDRTELERIPGWNEIDERLREEVAGRPMLFASSLATIPGGAVARGDLPAGRPFGQATPAAAPRAPLPLRLHAGGLAALIEQVGGRPVILPGVRVLAVLNPQVFLIESASPLPATRGNLARVLVLIEGATLRVDPALMVGAHVHVAGVARTLLGVRVTRDVAWPPELTPEMVERLEIRAAVLATSVHTADGVELTERRGLGAIDD